MPSERDRCHNCDRQLPTAEEWNTTPEGGRPDLCWEEGSGLCAPVDWRARALAAEAKLATARRESLEEVVVRLRKIAAIIVEDKPAPAALYWPVAGVEAALRALTVEVPDAE
jgi:hypothetical protein